MAKLEANSQINHVSHGDAERLPTRIVHGELPPDRPKGLKTGGRVKGTPNRVTTGVREALCELAQNNVGSVQEWLERVAVDNPAEAVRLFLMLARFVVPTLQAVALADITPKLMGHRLAAMSDQELLAIIQSESTPLRRISAPARPKPDPDDEELLR